MAVDTFIPEVWAASLLTTLEENLVFGQAGVVNTDYEGDISQFGDTVNIGSLTDPTISTYTKNSTTINPATLTTSNQQLVIDQTPYFAWEIDDIDARQVRDGGNLMASARRRSAFKLRDTADTFLASTMAVGAGTVLDPLYLVDSEASRNSAFLLIRRMKVELDRDSVPLEGRWLAVSPDFQGLMIGDSRFIDASQYGARTPILNGEIGQVAGFRVLVSNNLPVGTYGGSAPNYSNYVLAGHAMGCTWAQQINKIEAYRPENAFSDAVKGLHLYGAKVVRPECLVACDVDVNLGISA